MHHLSAPPPDLKALARRCPALQDLTLHNAEVKTVTELKLFKNLHTLELYSAGNLMKEDLEELIALPHLKNITLDEVELKGTSSWNQTLANLKPEACSQA